MLGKDNDHLYIASRIESNKTQWIHQTITLNTQYPVAALQTQGQLPNSSFQDISFHFRRLHNDSNFLSFIHSKIPVNLKRLLEDSILTVFTHATI